MNDEMMTNGNSETMELDAREQPTDAQLGVDRDHEAYCDAMDSSDHDDMLDLHMEYHDYRIATWEREESCPDIKEWLMGKIIRQREFAADLQDKLAAAEQDYRTLCHAIAGAGVHVQPDHAVAMLAEERKHARLMYGALGAIAEGNEREWLKSNPDVKSYSETSSRRVAAIAKAQAWISQDTDSMQFDDEEITPDILMWGNLRHSGIKWGHSGNEIRYTAENPVYDQPQPAPKSKLPHVFPDEVFMPDDYIPGDEY